jgi:hypothetical protein
MLISGISQAREDLKIICNCLASNVRNKSALKDIAKGNHPVVQKYGAKKVVSKLAVGSASSIMKKAKKQMDLIARQPKTAMHHHAKDSDDDSD